MKRWWRLILGFLALCLLFWALRYFEKRRAEKAREIAYQAILTSYQQVLKSGMNRREVENYIRTKGKDFGQMCCVDRREFNKHSWDDLIKIGEEEAPWVCSRNSVYLALQFVDSKQQQKETMQADDSDTLKSVTLFRQLEGCL